MDVVPIILTALVSGTIGYVLHGVRHQNEAARERWSARHKLMIVASNLPRRPSVALQNAVYFINDYISRQEKEGDPKQWRA